MIPSCCLLLSLQHRVHHLPLAVDIRLLIDVGQVIPQGAEGNEKLISHGAEIGPQGRFFSPLSLAARDGHLETAAGQSVFRIAVDTGNMDLVEMLVSKTTDVDEKDLEFGMTSLHRAVINGDGQLVRMLMKHVAVANVRDQKGHTALIYAVRHGHSMVEQFMRDNGATVRVEQYPLSLLHQSLERGEAVVWYLGHSGWAVKTKGPRKKKLLVIDYTQYGKMPDEPSLANGRIARKRSRVWMFTFSSPMPMTIILTK